MAIWGEDKGSGVCVCVCVCVWGGGGGCLMAHRNDHENSEKTPMPSGTIFLLPTVKAKPDKSLK